MKNNKIQKFFVLFTYLLFTVFFLFVAFEYLHDIFTDFERFKFMHSLGKNWLDLVIFVIWIVFSVLIAKLEIKNISGSKK